MECQHSWAGVTAMKAITFEAGLAQPNHFLDGQFETHRQDFGQTLKQASVVLAVFALGAMFHVMKWAGMVVL
jgi:hypothetical protein